MTNLTPDDVIKAFDETLDFVFGRSRGRDYPAREDVKFAQEWIDAGLTLTVAYCVFYHRMNIMHEYWLKQIDHRDNKNIPATLKFFDENIQAGIARQKAGGEPIAVWEQSESQWRARIKGFYSQGLWLHDMWGPSPKNPDCRAPSRLLVELEPKVKKKTASN